MVSALLLARYWQDSVYLTFLPTIPQPGSGNALAIFALHTHLLVLAKLVWMPVFLAALLLWPRRSTALLLLALLAIEAAGQSYHLAIWQWYFRTQPHAWIILASIVNETPIAILARVLLAWWMARGRSPKTQLLLLLIAVLLPWVYWLARGFNFSITGAAGSTISAAAFQIILMQVLKPAPLLAFLWAITTTAFARSARQLAARSRWALLAIGLELARIAARNEWTRLTLSELLTGMNLVVLASVVAAQLLGRPIEKLQRYLCPVCGYCLAGSSSACCSECGAPRHEPGHNAVTSPAATCANSAI